MAEREVKRRKLRKPAIGDMRERIFMYERAIQPPVFGDSSITESYTLRETVWAKVDTPVLVNSGKRVFNGVEVGQNVTHVFTVRYKDYLSTEVRINWEDAYYEILQETDFDSRQQFIELKTTLLGDDTLAANT